jgi:hypothetical protein
MENSVKTHKKENSKRVNTQTIANIEIKTEEVNKHK